MQCTLFQEERLLVQQLKQRAKGGNQKRTIGTSQGCSSQQVLKTGRTKSKVRIDKHIGIYVYNYY